MTADLLTVRLHSITYEAQDIHLFEFRPLQGRVLPQAAAGAHIDLHLPNGMVRSYSLVDPEGAADRYVIAVKNDPAGRGGSRLVHEALRVGQEMAIGPPRNNFPLREDAASSVFIAGGIGITPILGMVRRLERSARPWQLHYAARSPGSAAFLGELAALRPKTHLYFRAAFDAEQPAAVAETEAGALDIAALVAGLPREADLYCCGPLRMMTAFEEAAASRPPERVHVEYFAAREAAASEGGFAVVLQRSGRRIEVPPGQTILDALREAGLDMPYSCMEGVCGSCETRVLAGIPDHRDLILTKEERAANDRMMPCCSGSLSPTLTLDL